jgi:hypothetical protein
MEDAILNVIAALGAALAALAALLASRGARTRLGELLRRKLASPTVDVPQPSAKEAPAGPRGRVDEHGLGLDEPTREEWERWWAEHPEARPPASVLAEHPKLLLDRIEMWHLIVVACFVLAVVILIVSDSPQDRQGAWGLLGVVVGIVGSKA